MNKICQCFIYQLLQIYSVLYGTLLRYKRAVLNCINSILNKVYVGGGVTSSKSSKYKKDTFSHKNSFLNLLSLIFNQTQNLNVISVSHKIAFLFSMILNSTQKAITYSLNVLNFHFKNKKYCLHKFMNHKNILILQNMKNSRNNN
jgi:hypothetical protein